MAAFHQSMFKFRFHLSIASNYIRLGSIQVWPPNAGIKLIKNNGIAERMFTIKLAPKMELMHFFFSSQGDVTSNNFERDFADDFPAKTTRNNLLKPKHFHISV